MDLFMQFTANVYKKGKYRRVKATGQKMNASYYFVLDCVNLLSLKITS